MALTIELGDLVRALGRARASFTASVGPDSTDTTIQIAGLNLGSADLAGALVLLQAGALGAGSAATLASVTANTDTTLTVPALPAAPAAGYSLWIFGGPGGSPPLPALGDSTTVPLAADGTYETAAPYMNTLGVARIVGTVISDQAGTLYVRQSPDGGAHWDVQESIAVSAGDAAGAGQPFSVAVVTPSAGGAELYYVNGTTAQTAFRLFAWLMPD